MEMRCYCKRCTSYKGHVTNEEVCAKIQQANGPHKDLLTYTKTTQRRKETQTEVDGHVSHSSGLAKTSCKAHRKGEEDKAERKRDSKTISRNEQAWSVPSPTEQWRTEKLEETGCEVICGAQMTLAVKG